MITVKSVSHDLALTVPETTHVHNTIEQYSMNPVWNPVYRVRNLFRKFCSTSDWQVSENILERRVRVYLNQDTDVKRKSSALLKLLFSLHCSNTSSAGVSLAQFMGKEMPVQQDDNTGGLGLNEDEDFQPISEEEGRFAEKEVEELLLRRRHTEQVQMNYGFIHSPYGEAVM